MRYLFCERAGFAVTGGQGRQELPEKKSNGERGAQTPR